MPKPNRAGWTAIALTVASFTGGIAQDEIVLVLVGFVLALLLLYTFGAVVALGVAHRGVVASLSARFTPALVFPDNDTTLTLDNTTNIWELPAILIRYRIRLVTRDNRRIQHTFPRSLWKIGSAPLHVNARGAYYATADEVVIADLFGFFACVFHLPRGEACRLHVAPNATTNTILSTVFSGGSIHRQEQAVIRADDLVEQRPYTPGDDPRRINWKLYGHASALFVREEDREPPPHSILTLLISTSAEKRVFPRFNTEEPAKAVDVLCEAALALASRTLAAGGAVFLGAPDAALQEIADLETLARALATPFATPASEAGILPAATGNVLVLALPETHAGAVTRFVEHKTPTQRVSVLFLYREATVARAAQISASRFTGRTNVNAQSIRFQ
jgi:uncharacterized protein (DUF58 family)